MIELVTATEADFPQVFPLIQALWNYNRYEEDATRAVYRQIVTGRESFALIARDGGRTLGFCHGDFFPTLWMCGVTCYLSGIITLESERGRGIGSAMIARVRTLARERGARAVILDSGLQRTDAHRFYEARGFVRSCYGFELAL